jgi:CXXC-20-CXXC protein
MPTCKYCGSKWSWFDSIKQLFRFRKSMKCNHCGEIQYQSSSSRNKTSLFVLSPIIIIPLSILFNLSPTSILLVELALIVAVLFIMPFFLKLTEKDEPMW